VNRQYGIGDNAKTLVWMAIQVFLLFSFVEGKPSEVVSKFIKNIMRCSVVIWFVGVTISFGQFLLVIKYVADFSEYARRQGFYDERLFGVFSDPNYASVTSLVIVLFTVVLYMKEKKKAWKVFYIISGVMELFYILLSGSRTALVCSYVTLPIFFFFILRNKWKNAGKAWIGSLAITVVCASLLTFTAPFFVNMTEYTKGLRSLFGIEEPKQAVSLERTDTTDPTNSRFKIWSSAIKVSGDNRIVGLSPRNLTPYAKANHPDSYIALSEYQAHNGYVAVIVGSGMLGCICVLALLVYLIKRVIWYLKQNKEKEYSSTFIVSICSAIAIGVSAMFFLDIFFVNTYTTALFFIFCGKIASYGVTMKGK
jgi:O-antigen ligase